LTIPYIIRTFEFKQPFHEFKWDSWVYSAFEVTIGALIPFFNFTFVVAGVIDFQRRRMMIKACGTLIDPYKGNYDPIYRIFPTINLIDS
jgi:hypothetical protein